MLKRLKQIKQDERGSAVVWAIVVIIILLIILTAGMSIALRYNNRNFQNNNERQAYYTARSVVTAVAEEITNSDESKNKIMAQLGLMIEKSETDKNGKTTYTYEVQENEANVVKTVLPIKGMDLPDSMVDQGEDNLKTTIQVLPDTIKGSQETEDGKKLDLHQVKISCTATYRGNTRTVSAIMQEKQVSDSRGFVYGINADTYERENSSSAAVDLRDTGIENDIDLFVKSGYNLQSNSFSTASFKRNLLSQGNIIINAGTKPVRIFGMVLSDANVTLEGNVQVGGQSGSTTSESGILAKGIVNLNKKNADAKNKLMVSGDITAKSINIHKNVTINGNIKAENVTMDQNSNITINGTIYCNNHEALSGNMNGVGGKYEIKPLESDFEIKSKVPEDLDKPPEAFTKKIADAKELNMAELKKAVQNVITTQYGGDLEKAPDSTVLYKQPGVTVTKETVVKNKKNTPVKIITIDNFSGENNIKLTHYDNYKSINVNGSITRGNAWWDQPDTENFVENLAINIKVNQNNKGDVYVGLNPADSPEIGNYLDKDNRNMFLRIVNVDYYEDDGITKITDASKIKAAKVYVHTDNTTINGKSKTALVVFAGNQYDERWQNQSGANRPLKIIAAYVYATNVNLGLVNKADADLLAFYGNINVSGWLKDRGAVSYNQKPPSETVYVNTRGELVTKWIVDKYEDE